MDGWCGVARAKRAAHASPTPPRRKTSSASYWRCCCAGRGPPLPSKVWLRQTKLQREQRPRVSCPHFPSAADSIGKSKNAPVAHRLAKHAIDDVNFRRGLRRPTGAGEKHQITGGECTSIALLSSVFFARLISGHADSFLPDILSPRGLNQSSHNETPPNLQV